MSDIQCFQRLFSYDDWANRELISALQSIDDPPARSAKLLAHILSAEKLWWQRLTLKPQTYPVWPEFTLAKCKAEAEELRELHTFLEDLREGLGQDSLYNTSLGTTNQKHLYDRVRGRDPQAKH